MAEIQEATNFPSFLGFIQSEVNVSILRVTSMRNQLWKLVIAHRCSPTSVGRTHRHNLRHNHSHHDNVTRFHKQTLTGRSAGHLYLSVYTQVGDVIRG